MTPTTAHAIREDDRPLDAAHVGVGTVPPEGAETASAPPTRPEPPRTRQRVATGHALHEDDDA